MKLIAKILRGVYPQHGPTEKQTVTEIHAQITNNPKEWFNHDLEVWNIPGKTWVHTKGVTAWSLDGGKSYYLTETCFGPRYVSNEYAGEK